jgi:O-antigen/teichoic acid export membrane protein
MTGSASTDPAPGARPAADPGLAASASRGALTTLAGQGVRILVQLAGIVVLARLLSPDDYGVVAIVTVFIGLGEIFRDFGLTSAAIQAKVLTDGQRDNLFWLNTGIGGTLAALVCAASPLVALAFDDPRLTAITVVLSATFVLNGISTQYRAGLARHLRFGRLTTAETLGQLGGVVIGIVAAVLGAGYWALVAQQLGQGLVTQVLLVRAGRWFPGRIRRSESIRPFIGYGAPLLGSQLLNYLYANVDTVTLGARFGSAPVGVYNRAFQLVMMPLLQVQAPATRVALPVLSRIQAERRRFADFVCFGQLALLTVVGLPFAVLFAQAPAVVEIALGPQWEESVPLFRVLLVAGFFQAATYAVYWVFLAQGLTGSQLRYALATRPAMALLVVAGSLWGVQGVAVGYTLGIALAWPLALWWIRRVGNGISMRMLRTGLRSGSGFALASGASYLATREMSGADAWLLVAVGTVVVLAVVALLTLLPPYRRDLVALADLRKHLSRRPRRPAPAAIVEAGPPVVEAGPPVAGKQVP